MNDDTIYFAKIKPTAQIPYKRDEDWCYDIYACFDENELILKPFTTTLVPTWIASIFNKKYRIWIRERSSNSKTTLKVSAGQIDSGYRWEYFVALYNGNEIPVEISKSVNEIVKTHQLIRHPYSKAIAQFAIELVPQTSIQEVSYEEIQKIVSERGIWALWSSGK